MGNGQGFIGFALFFTLSGQWSMAWYANHINHFPMLPGLLGSFARRNDFHRGDIFRDKYGAR